MNSHMFTLNFSDLAKGLIMAVLGGIALPIDAVIHTPGFSLATTDWQGMAALAFNGAVIGGITYLIKNFLSTPDGKVLGTIG